MAAKFEYKVQTILYNRDHAAVEAALNAAGAEGWRVFDLRWQVSSHDFVFITFEREVPRDPDLEKKEAETDALARAEQYKTDHFYDPPADATLSRA